MDARNALRDGHARARLALAREGLSLWSSRDGVTMRERLDALGFDADGLLGEANGGSPRPPLMVEPGVRVVLPAGGAS